MSPLWSQPDDVPDWPDAALRGVDLPPGFAERLGAIPVESDADLDRLLCDVPARPGLVSRLCQLGVAQDEHRKRRDKVEQKAVAATLVVASWCSYAAALILFWAADYSAAPENAESWLHTTALAEHASVFGQTTPLAMLDESLAVEMPATPENAPASELAAWDEANAAEPSDADSLLALNWSSQYSPGYDFSALVDSPAAAPSESTSVAIPPAGRFDRDFLARTGVLPRLDPRKLPLSQPPLSAAGDSFAFARQSLAAGRLLPAAEIRTEDFLAAVDFGFPPPKDGALALVAQGGQAAWLASPRTGAENRPLGLLQLAVQAKDLAKRKNAADGKLAAKDVRLSVRFNPEAVKSYRLCGHEPRQSDGQSDGRQSDGPQSPPGRDFSPGEAATVVYELELSALDGDAELATVTLEWRDAASGAPQVRTRQIISREIAAPFGKAQESVQLAAMAVAAAEVLRQSPFAEPISPAEMLSLARTARDASSRPQRFETFVELFERCMAIEATESSR